MSRARVTERDRTHRTWDLRESGPLGAEYTVLLLPGALATWPFYDDLVRQPKLSGASIRFVAATIPGFGGTPPPHDQSVENYASLAGRLAHDFDCDVVVGHSFGANIALEMAARGEFSGPLVLLAPSFSRKDESRFPRVVDRLGRVLGNIPFKLAFKTIGSAMKGEFPADRHDVLVAELRKNEAGPVRRHLRAYLNYLDRYGSLVPRLCDSGARAWVVFGEDDEVGVTDEERRQLDQCPRVTLLTIPASGHFTLNQEPGRIADLVLEAVASAKPAR